MRVIRRVLYSACALVVIAAVFLWHRSDVRPTIWQPAPLPALDGPFTVTDAATLIHARFLSVPALGPEDVASNTQGTIFTGLANGQIVQIKPEAIAAEPFVNTGGRPLGLQFTHQGDLLVADAARGLLSITPDGALTVMTSEVDGVALTLTDDLDIAEDGSVWFTDASQRFGLDDWIKDLLEASFTGRLLRFDPATGNTTVAMDGLHFANGVALGPDEQFVLVSETGTGRIHRLWLKTERAGERDIFYDGLPGHPDNLSFNGHDTFWVALPGLRSVARERSSGSIWLRRLLGGLASTTLIPHSPHTLVVGLDVNGEVTHFIADIHDQFSSVTSVNQVGDVLHLGSLTADRIAVVPVPAPLKP
ncbi:MAG: SMP-30/gluconolactonase/LRE family protein [Pseudomonadota bacterium]